MPKNNTEFKTLNELLKWYESKMPEHIVLVKNKERYDIIANSVDVISNFVKEISPDAKITITPGEIDQSAFYLKIVTDEIIIEDITDFCVAIKEASNFEIYPLEDGNLSMSILFNGAYEAAPPHGSKK